MFVLIRTTFEYIHQAPSNISPWNYLTSFLTLPAFTATHLITLEENTNIICELDENCVYAWSTLVEIEEKKQNWTNAIQVKKCLVDNMLWC